MQCLNPIYVPNQSRFVNLASRHSFLVPARCGKCANCQQNKSAEWAFRAYVHADDCFRRKGYVLFDSLTYSDEYLPHLSDFEEFSLLTPNEDFSCFSSDHLRHFFVRLRRKLRYLGFEKDVFNYFISTEYGSDKNYIDSSGKSRKATYRPHYHVLFYVYADIDPLLFSSLVADSWFYGRTDGIPYRSVMYVQQNVFRSAVVGSRRVVNYVTKYVQKSVVYEDKISNRIALVLHRIAPNIDWLSSDTAKMLRRKLYRVATQFHRQSIGFGSSILADIDLDELFDCGFFKMPNGKPNMFNRVPISNYYLRKVCYYKHTFPDGYQCWFVRPFAKRYLEKRSCSLQRNLSNYYRGLAMDFDMQFDSDDLADYMLNYKGRLVNDDLPDKSYLSVMRPNWYVYASIADKNHFNHRFISSEYLGCKDNYRPVSCRVYPLRDVFDNLLFNQASMPRFHGYDDILSNISKRLVASNQNKQALYKHLQRIHQVAKCFN